MVTLPTPALDFSALTDFFEDFEIEIGDMSSMTAGVLSEGPGSEYALVWEYGNARQTKKGPKTTLGVTPDGKRVWLSLQAPHGYIRVFASTFADIIAEELSSVQFTSAHIQRQLEKALTQAAVRMAQIIREAAPYDSGGLAASIRAVGPGELVVDEDEDDWDL